MTKSDEKKGFLAGVCILIGTAIGAGVLGIPYVAAQTGFLPTVGYIIGIGLMAFLINLYIGEISLRTKGNHQLVGYARKYLGKKGEWFMGFATIFLIYAASVAYMLGVGESLSYLFFANSSQATILGVIFGIFMAYLVWKEMKGLKVFEEMGVGMVMILFVVILLAVFKNIEISNLMTYTSANVFLPFGIILFAFLAFHSIPEVKIALHGREKLMKKVIIVATIIPMIFYILFTLVVVGFKGTATPEIATIALGPIFIFLGMFTIFTSYLALGNALLENFMFDEKMKKISSWVLSSIVPITIFLLLRLTDFFSFTKILSIGGTVSGGLIAVLVLLMVRKAKQKGSRKPEYEIPINKFIVFILSLVFILGVLYEVWGYLF